MPHALPRPGTYCLHKSSGQAFVRLAGKTYYLGRYGTPESRETFRRLVGSGKVAELLPDEPVIVVGRGEGGEQ